MTTIENLSLRRKIVKGKRHGNAANKRAIQPADRSLGQKIRMFRNEADISQEQLGKRLVPPVSFQQVQKYEKGVNRVSHTRLTQIAQILKQDLSAFSDEHPSGSQSKLIGYLGDPMLCRGLNALATMKRDMAISCVHMLEKMKRI